MEYQIKDSVIEIDDKENLIPDKMILEKIIGEHPLCENLYTYINKVVIKPYKFPRIGYNLSNKIVTLDLCSEKTDIIFGATSKRKNYHYILYHEFSHVADKVNSDFKYTDEKRNSLTDEQRFKLMELWNVNIDARLNAKNKFQLSPDDRVDPIKSEASIQGKLMKHIRALKLKGFVDADYIVNELWRKPNVFVSYDSLISFTLSSGKTASGALAT